MVHTTDVDGMLERMSPEQFAEWCAFDRVDPIGLQGLCDLMANFAVAICRGFGLDVDQSQFMRWVEAAGENPDVISPNQAARMLAGVKGVVSGDNR